MTKLENKTQGEVMKVTKLVLIALTYKPTKLVWHRCVGVSLLELNYDNQTIT